MHNLPLAVKQNMSAPRLHGSQEEGGVTPRSTTVLCCQLRYLTFYTNPEARKYHFSRFERVICVGYPAAT